MYDRTAIRRDTNLLKKAQAVFGYDLVIDAFICALPCQSERHARDLLAAMRHTSAEVIDGGFTYDGEVIRLVFSNGRTVEFSNSEWAYIGNPSDTVYVA